MTLGRGRLLRGDVSATPIARGALPPQAGRRIDRDEAAAHARAREILGAAERRARAVLAHAERGAADARLKAEEIGRARGLTELSAWSLRLAEREARADEVALDRTVELARLLAERLLGSALELSPALVTKLAHEALAEVRAARRVRLFANPSDVVVLNASVSEFDPEGRLHEIVADPELGNGDLRLETELGSVDAKLGGELERLASRLKEALRS